MTKDHQADLHANWSGLFKVATVAAIVSELVLLLGLVTYFIWPYSPGSRSTEHIFLLLQDNPLGGLISLDLFLLVGNLFSLFLFLALFVSLRQVDGSYALIALAMGLVGLVLLIPARPLIEIRALSQTYASATSEAARNQALASGDTLLALFEGTGWFLNTLLGGFSLLVSSLLMLRSAAYSKATAYVGIVSNAMVCLFYLPFIGVFLLFLSVPGYMLWYFLLARTFFRLGWGGSGDS